MNKITRIFNPYGLLMIGVFIEYYPAFFNKISPSIRVGSVSLYITDISFILLFIFVFFSFFLGGRSSSKGRYEGVGIQVIFGLFIMLSFIKWLFQTQHDVSSIRTLVNYTSAYAFLFFFPTLVTRKAELRSLQYFLILFLVYIFILHIYAFATRGFASHILSGGFLTMLSLLYFLAMSRNHVLALSSTASFFVKALVITTFVMVGHRSGFVGLLLGLIALLFFNKKSAVKETAALLVVIVMGAGVAIALSPNLLSKLSERASTTFDTSQQTYQERYSQYFLITQVSMEEHPIIGKPLGSESVSLKRVTREVGGISKTQDELLLNPHNLLLEWLYHYGLVGLLLGLTLLIMCVRFIKRFLAENKNNSLNYQMGVAVLCCMAHNLFFALTNVTVMSSFATFFLYFPVMILVSLSRNKNTVHQAKGRQF